jgi:ubiquinone/menaquinone biosynthesis C-methylase UbiE
MSHENKKPETNNFYDGPNRQLPFGSGDSVDAYEVRRYSGRSQNFLDRLERDCLQQMIRDQKSSPGDTILDMPCGFGRIAPMLVELGLKPLWGDISMAMARRVSMRSEATAAVGQFVGDAEHIPLASNSVEGATCIRLLQHFRQGETRARIMRELGRVVRSWMIVSFYDQASIHGKTKKLACKLQGKKVIVAMQSRASLLAEANAAGLELNSICAPARFVHAHTFALLVPR